MRENAQSWIIKILFAIIILAFVLTFGVSSFDDKGDPIFAYVDDDPITRQEFDVALARLVENLRSNKQFTAEMLNSPLVKQMVRDELINTRLILHEAKRLGISVSDEEVYKVISTMPAFRGPTGAFDQQRYEALLRAQRLTPAQFEQDYKLEVLKHKLYALVTKTAQATPEQARSIYDWQRETARIKYLKVNTADFMAQAEVTENQVQKFYQDNLDKFQKPLTASFEYIAFTPQQLAALQQVSDEELQAYYDAHKESFQQEEQVRARHILIALDETASPAEVKKAEKKIKGILAQARSGKNFAKLAEKYSEGPSAPSGGDLGWFGRGAMVPAFEKAAFALKKGKVSDPVRTQFGLHIIQVEDRKDAKVLSFDEVKDDIKDMIAQDKASDRVSDLLDDSMDRLFSGMSLADIAKELKLDVAKTPLVSAAQVQQVFGMSPDTAETLFAAAKGESPKTPLSIQGGYLLAVKLDENPAAPLAIEKVREFIVTELKKQEAAKLAEAKAGEVLEALTGDQAEQALATYSKDIKESEPFDRKGSIKGLTQAPQLAFAVFAAEKDGWLPKVFNAGDGFVLANRIQVIPAPEEAWDKEKNAWIQRATSIYAQELFDAYVKDLHANADIVIERTDLMN